MLASSKLPIRGSHSARPIALHPAVKWTAPVMHFSLIVYQNPATFASSNYFNHYKILIFYYYLKEGRAGVAW
jgi:hypothetical protein